MSRARLVCLSGLVAVLCALCVSLTGSFSSEAPSVFAAAGGASISDVMVVAHSGNLSIQNELKDALKDPGPSSDKDWKEVKARGAVLTSLATDVLAKQSPRKGSASSWKKLVAEYAAMAQKLAAAASEKDLAATNDAVKALGRSCSGCHKPHK